MDAPYVRRHVVCARPRHRVGGRAFYADHYLGSLGEAVAVLYKPDSGPRPTSLWSSFIALTTSCVIPHVTGLAQRGFMMLCVNTCLTDNQGLVRFDDIALDAKPRSDSCVHQPGII